VRSRHSAGRRRSLRLLYHPRYQSGLLVIPAAPTPTTNATAPMPTAPAARREARPPIPAAISAIRSAIGISRSGRYAIPVTLTKIEAAARNPATVSDGRERSYGVELTLEPRAAACGRTFASGGRGGRAA